MSSILRQHLVIKWGEEVDEQKVIKTSNVNGAPIKQTGEELDADGNPIINDDDDDDDDDQSNMSLAAMEAELKPRVLEILDRIASDYSQLSEMQDDRISATLNDGSDFSESQEKFSEVSSEVIHKKCKINFDNLKIINGKNF